MQETTTIEARELIGKDRLNALPRYFGLINGLKVENAVFNWARKHCLEYGGGMWRYMEIPNGFFMCPESAKEFTVQIPDNYFEGRLSPEAVGIVACLFAYSVLSFRTEDESFSDHYIALEQFARCHPEASQILAAID